MIENLFHLGFPRRIRCDQEIAPTGLGQIGFLPVSLLNLHTGLKNTTHILQFTIMSDIVPKTLHTQRQKTLYTDSLQLNENSSMIFTYRNKEKANESIGN